MTDHQLKPCVLEPDRAQAQSAIERTHAPFIREDKPGRKFRLVIGYTYYKEGETRALWDAAEFALTPKGVQLALDYADQAAEGGHDVYFKPGAVRDDWRTRSGKTLNKHGKTRQPHEIGNDDMAGAAALWIDCDEPAHFTRFRDATRETSAWPWPSFHVVTGTAPSLRRQSYWLLDKPIATGLEWEALSADLSAFFAADPAVKHIGRWMRLPGYCAHPKPGKEGRIPELVQIRDGSGEQYPAAEIEAAFGGSARRAQLARLQPKVVSDPSRFTGTAQWRGQALSLGDRRGLSAEDAISILDNLEPGNWHEGAKQATASLIARGDVASVLKAYIAKIQAEWPDATLKGRERDEQLDDLLSGAVTKFAPAALVEIADEEPEPDMSVLAPPEVIDAPEFKREWLGRWRNWIESAAAATDAPIEYLFFGLLATISGLTGRVVKFAVDANWTEIAAVWVLLVGRPGSRKSPAHKVFIQAIYRCSERLIAEWEAKNEAIDDHNANLEKGDLKLEKPPKPRLFITSCTADSMVVEFNAQDARNLFAAPDEFMGLFGDLARHSGGDRANMLSGWSGGPAETSRISRGPQSAPEFSLAIYSTIQPEPFAEAIASGSDDGFRSRFWPIYPERPPLPDEPDLRERPPLDRDFLVRALDALLPPTMIGTFTDILRMTGEARTRFYALKHDFDRRAREAQATPEEAVWNKMPGHVVKLAGLLELAEWIHKFGEGEKPLKPRCITLASLERAAEIALEYIVPMIERSFGSYEPAELKEIRRLAQALREKPKFRAGMEVSVRMLSRDGPRAPGKKYRRAEDVRTTALALQDAGWLLPKDDPRGNPNGARWIINQRIKA